MATDYVLDSLRDRDGKNKKLIILLNFSALYGAKKMRLDRLAALINKKPEIIIVKRLLSPVNNFYC